MSASLHLEEVAQFSCHLQELGKGISQEGFVMFVKRFAAKSIDTRSDVSSRGHRGAPPCVVTPRSDAGIIERVGITHGGDELVAEADSQGTVLLHDGVELGRMVLQHIEGQAEWSERMLRCACRLEGIDSATTKREQTEESGAIQLVGIEFELCLSRKAETTGVQPRKHQARIGQSGGKSQFPRIDFGTLSCSRPTRLPFVGSIQFH